MNFVRLTAGTSLLLSMVIQTRIARPLQSVRRDPSSLTLHLNGCHRGFTGRTEPSKAKTISAGGATVVPCPRRQRRPPLTLQSVRSRRQTGGRGGLTKDQLLEAMEGHVLSEGELIDISYPVA